MSSDTVSLAATERVSLVQLSLLHERVLRLRSHLRTALLDDGPQLEMIIFNALVELYQSYYAVLLESRTTALTTSTEIATETRFATSAYSQDVLAACLYLIDVSSLPDSCVLADHPPSLEEVECEANASTVYVSTVQRRFARDVFLHLCWSDASLPLKEVQQALYPLLDPGVGVKTCGNPITSNSIPSAGDTAESTVAANLFARPRFANRKAFIAETLSGLVFSRPNGLGALLRVLLLNDRVEAETTVEAAQLVVRMLTAPITALWIRERVTDTPSFSEHTYTVRRDNAAATEEQIKRIGPQVLRLLEEHAELPTSMGSKESITRPRFLARLQAQTQRLPAETLEHRLHLFLTLYLNALVTLPPRSSSDFARSYRRFFFTNTHLLTAGFGALSLRRVGPMSQAEALAALYRLTALANGVALGAATGAVSRLFPAVAAGILNLTSLLAEEKGGDGGDVGRALRRFWPLLLSSTALHELVAHVLVRVCAEVHSHSFLSLNTVERAVRYTEDACTPAVLCHGMEWLLLELCSTTPDFAHDCVIALIEWSEVQLYASGVDALAEARPALSSADVDTPSSSSSDLLLLLEKLCLQAPAELLFGQSGRLSFTSTLAFLHRVLRLSPVLHRWAADMIISLLRSDSLQLVLRGAFGTAGMEPESEVVHRRTLEQLERVCQGLLRAVKTQELSFSLRQNDATASAGEMADSVLRVTELRAAIESCITDVGEELAALETECRPLSMTAMMALSARWQQLSTQLLSALDSKAPAEVAVTLTALCRSIDEAVYEVRDTTALLSSVQPLLQILVRVLYEVDDVAAAARAVHAVAWLCMYRFDSADSAFVADLVWVVLAEGGKRLPPWIRAPAVAASAAATPRRWRMQARFLDVLLAWTDYDTDGRTLRNVDDVIRRRHHISLFDLLAGLCHSTADVFVQVATLHLVGPYALAMYPRVSLIALCELCRDVFQLSPHEMAKAACAASLGTVVVSLCNTDSCGAALLTEVDLEAVQTLASAMASYRGRPLDASSMKATALQSNAAVDMHDAVIQQHGRDVLRLLRTTSQQLSSSSVPDAVERRIF